jgi:hypothetical protein
MTLAATHLSPAISQRVEVIAVAVLVCGLILELVRRKRMMERYALLWLLAGATVLALGLWQGLLTTVSHAVGIYYPPAALFAVAFLFVLVMLVHFSTSVSRLADQNKMLAQRLALLQQRVDQQGASQAIASESNAFESNASEPLLEPEDEVDELSAAL